jgi:hypothetical protein
VILKNYLVIINSSILLSISVYLMMPAVAQHKDENPMNRSTLHNDLIDNAIFSGDSRRTQVQIDRHSICVYVCDELDS